MVRGLKESILSSFFYSLSHCCLKCLTKSSLEAQALGFGLQSVMAGMWWQEYEAVGHTVSAARC